MRYISKLFKWSSPSKLDIGSWYVTQTPHPNPPRTLPSWIIKLPLVPGQVSGIKKPKKTYKLLRLNWPGRHCLHPAAGAIVITHFFFSSLPGSVRLTPHPNNIFLMFLLSTKRNETEQQNLQTFYVSSDKSSGAPVDNIIRVIKEIMISAWTSWEELF